MTKSRVWLHVSVLLLVCLLHLVSSLDCGTCGKECVQACGTKKFRNCCYNYIRKRSEPVSRGPGLHMELMMIGPEVRHYYPTFEEPVKSHTEGNFAGGYPKDLTGRK